MNWDIFADRFMQNAIIATFLAGVACSFVGVFVVTMKLSFIGVCMSHAAFAGALFGLVVGFNPLVMALIFSLVTASALGPIADRSDFSPDTALGIMFSAALGISFLLLSMIPGPKSEALGLLWGNVLTVSRANLMLLLLVTFGITLLVTLLFKEIQAIIFNRELALAIGIPATAVFYGLLICSGMAITASLNAIGGLLVYSLIVNPAATAYQLTYNLKRMFLLAACFGVLSGWIGLVLSYFLNLPTGALIIVVSTLFFAISAIFSPKRRFSKLPTNPEVRY
jgi:manganese/iron transport system permease protein